MKDKINLLRLSLKYGGKLHTLLGMGFTYGVFNKITEEAMTKTLNEIIDRAEQAEKLEKENIELRSKVKSMDQIRLF